MTIGTLLKASFIMMFITVIAGAYLKITHYERADTLLVIGIIVGLIFIITALYEILTSKRITSGEKTLWTIGILFMSGIIGIVYLFSGRNIIANNL
jgi:hypothetical protein